MENEKKVYTASEICAITRNNSMSRIQSIIDTTMKYIIAAAKDGQCYCRIGLSQLFTSYERLLDLRDALIDLGYEVKIVDTEYGRTNCGIFISWNTEEEIYDRV